ncbi:hypothetical protein [Hyphomicrobium sp. 2TAF46]|uniref:hypothetical protein n=1 Tax=Hyphomicrobium sp. 2TAF46 TaxID=3233019 RepID=UPI003F926FF3
MRDSSQPIAGEGVGDGKREERQSACEKDDVVHLMFRSFDLAQGWVASSGYVPLAA